MSQSLGVLREFVTMLRDSPGTVGSTPSATLIALEDTSTPEDGTQTATPIATATREATPTRTGVSATDGLPSMVPPTPTIPATIGPATIIETIQATLAPETPTPQPLPATALGQTPALLPQDESGRTIRSVVEGVVLFAAGMGIGLLLGYWLVSQKRESDG
jgi:hypothetical protein